MDRAAIAPGARMTPRQRAWQTEKTNMNEDLHASVLEMPFLKNVGLFMTYKCQVTCPHCIVEAGPHRKEQVQRREAFDWIRQVADYRNGHVRVVSLTGGEPFYDIGLLKELAEFANARGLFVSAVTNAFWASEPERAVALLRELGALKMLSISTDVHHQQHIPFDWVRNAVRAAEQCDMLYSIAVCTESEDDPKYQNVLKQLQTITTPRAILTAITFPAGRALVGLTGSKYQRSEEPPVSACPAGSSPIIFPDGRVMACIGPVITLGCSHPLLLGNLRESSLDAILDRAEVNPVLHAIRVWGPRKLIAMVNEAGLGEHLPRTYIKDSMCNACYALMSNHAIRQFLAECAGDPLFLRRVAYARQYYLNETKMVELLRLNALHPGCVNVGNSSGEVR